MLDEEYDYKSILERVVNHYQEYLNNWELEFIASVYEHHVLNDYNLTDKQKEKILSINRRLLSRRGYNGK